MSTEQTVIVALVSLALSAFFSGAETGFMSTSRVRLRGDTTTDPARIDRLLHMLRDIEDPIMSCLIGTNLFNVTFTAVITAALTAHFAARGQWISLILCSFVIITLGEILPKVLFREFPERLTLAAVPGVSLAMRILVPVRWALQVYTATWDRLLPAGENQGGALDRRSLAALLLTNTAPNPDDRRFAETLDRFLLLAGHPLTDIMQPLGKVVGVRPDTTVAECLRVAARSGFSRLPIAWEDGHRVQAYLLVRDLLFLPREDHGRCVPRKLWRTFLLVDERMSPYELFEEMRGQRRQVAFVVDAHGNPRGLVTLEDLIEKVMGSIRDEFDPGGAPRAVHADDWSEDG
jgi:CBS domain containing-hemolysin-like protein